jgi:hypothetical protein
VPSVGRDQYPHLWESRALLILWSRRCAKDISNV